MADRTMIECRSCEGGGIADNKRRLSQAILLFYSPRPWDEAEQGTWRVLTGGEATTKTLGDFARHVQGYGDRCFPCWGTGEKQAPDRLLGIVPVVDQGDRGG